MFFSVFFLVVLFFKYVRALQHPQKKQKSIFCHRKLVNSGQNTNKYYKNLQFSSIPRCGLATTKLKSVFCTVEAFFFDFIFEFKKIIEIIQRFGTSQPTFPISGKIQIFESENELNFFQTSDSTPIFFLNQKLILVQPSHTQE